MNLLIFGLILLGTTDSRKFNEINLIRNYIGCFRNLAEQKTADRHRCSRIYYDVRSCLECCHTRGSTFAGLKNGGNCYCGENFEKSSNESNCQMKCSRSELRNCGGKLDYSVFSVCEIGYHGNECNQPCNGCSTSVLCSRNDGQCLYDCHGNRNDCDISRLLTDVNIAFKRPVNQSSTHVNGEGTTYPPELAVDGSFNNTFESKYEANCSETKKDAIPWFRVDLGQSTPIRSIVITNRAGGYGSRLDGVTIYSLNKLPDIIDSVDNFNTKGNFCKKTEYIGDQDITVELNCTSVIKGRYLFAVLPRKEHLTICEIEIFAENCIVRKNCKTNEECKKINFNGSVYHRCFCKQGFSRQDLVTECQGRCSEVTIRNEVYGSIHFGEGEVNETKSSISKCLESAQAKATGMCLYNSSVLFYWKILEFHCTTENRTTFSEVKKELSDLKDKVTKNFEGAVEEALNIVKDKLENMSADDVKTVTRFVDEASNVYKKISEKRAESLIKIMGVAMEAPVLAPNKTAIKRDKDVVKTQISLINTLESVVSKMDLNAASYNKTFNKFRVEVYEQMEIENRNFTFNPLASESDDTEKAKGQIEVIIPKEAFESARNQKIGKLRANFIIYNSTELFENPSQSESQKNLNEKIVSNIISGSIAGANITGLQKKINLIFQVANVTESLKCVFADFSNDSWMWSDEGMETKKEKDKGKVLCQSDHLTNFAVLAGYKDDKYSTALTYISIVGMVLSIICLSFLIFTQMFFKKFRKGQYQIALLNLAVSLIIVNLLIILGLDRIENKVVCGIVAALLHYFLLVSFAWMLIEAILQYYKFVKVFNVHVSSFVWKIVLPAWTLPALVVIMTAAIDHKQYSASKTHCWLAKEAFHYAFLLPLAFVVAANTFIFIRIIKGISCDRPKGMQTNQTKSRLVWLQVQAGICCFIVMGLTWCFALFAFGKAAIVMQFLFAIFNSMQGCFVFILFCLREKPVRKAWYALLCQGKASKKLISSTDSQSSSSLGKFKRRIKKEDNELSRSDFSGTKNTESTDAALSKI